ncbi:hypothetical protein YC2023_081943 [Brassica napus]
MVAADSRARRGGESIEMKEKIDLICDLLAPVPYFSASVSMIFINKAVIMQCPHSMPFLTLPLGTEDFQQQKQVANSSLIHCGIQNGTQQSQPGYMFGKRNPTTHMWQFVRSFIVAVLVKYFVDPKSSK